jgi:hypothetical protein
MAFNPGIPSSALTFDMLHSRFLKTKRRKPLMISMALHLKLPVLIPTHLVSVVASPVLEDSLGRRRQGKALEISLNSSSIPFPVKVDRGPDVHRVTIFRPIFQSVS